MSSPANWNAVAALAASVAALAAVVSVWVVFRQVKQEAALSRYSVGIEALLHLEDNWRQLAPVRSRAAGEIATNKPGRNVVDVLDFFDTVAKLTKNGVLDRNLVWHTFYWPMANYWMAAQDFVRQTQSEEGSATWEDYSELIGEMRNTESQRSKRPLAAIGPSTDQVAEFMAEEKKP